MMWLVCWLFGHRWEQVTVQLNYDPPTPTGDLICTRCWAVTP